MTDRECGASERAYVASVEDQWVAAREAEDAALADHPIGCTCDWCVPTSEQSAEVAEMLRKPLTFPHEDEVPF